MRRRSATAGPNDATRTITRDLGVARSAFEGRDGNLSRAAHSIPSGTQSQTGAVYLEPGHAGGERSVMKSFVYGAIDGVSAVCVLFALSSACQADVTQLRLLLTGGIAGLAAGCTLRELGRFGARNDEFAHERKREAWELTNFAEGEIKEMQELYVAKGLSAKDSALVVDVLAGNKEFFVDLMMAQELGLTPPDSEPRANASAAGLGFIAFALIPVASVFLATTDVPTGTAAAATAVWPFIASVIVAIVLIMVTRRYVLFGKMVRPNTIRALTSHTSRRKALSVRLSAHIYTYCLFS